MAATPKQMLVWYGRESDLPSLNADSVAHWLANCPGHIPANMSLPADHNEADFMIRQINPEARALFVGTRTMRMEWLLGAAERYGVDHIDLTI